ncbi:TolC family protein [Sphingobacterium sp. E70]|nr:TolC family protein [Sphingobacterium sp. E70]
MQLLEKENAQLQFEELLRNLKYDLRSQCLELQVLQEKERLYSNQVGIFQKLAQSYQNQWKEGNVSEMDYLRIQSESMAFGNKLNEIQQEKIAKMNDVARYLGAKERRFPSRIPSVTLPLLRIDKTNGKSWPWIIEAIIKSFTMNLRKGRPNWK